MAKINGFLLDGKKVSVLKQLVVETLHPLNGKSLGSMVYVEVSCQFRNTPILMELVFLLPYVPETKSEYFLSAKELWTLQRETPSGVEVYVSEEKLFMDFVLNKPVHVEEFFNLDVLSVDLLAMRYAVQFRNSKVIYSKIKGEENTELLQKLCILYYCLINKAKSGTPIFRQVSAMNAGTLYKAQGTTVKLVDAKKRLQKGQTFYIADPSIFFLNVTEPGNPEKYIPCKLDISSNERYYVKESQIFWQYM